MENYDLDENQCELDKNTKDELCKELCGLYFCKNFGKITKADFELVLFKHYISYCNKNGISTSDYDLSKRLGILQSKVRSLKQQKYKKYDINDNDWWKKEIKESLGKARYDSDNNRIKFIVEDVNVKEELVHYIEEKGWYNETSLNKKLFILPLQCYLDILCDEQTFKDVFSEEAKKAMQKKCDDSDLDQNIKDKAIDFTKSFTKDALNDVLKTGTKELIIFIITSLIPFGGPIKGVLEILVKVIGNSK